jgi:acyl carrier protein
MSSTPERDLLGGIRACMQAALKLSDADAAAISIETTPNQLSGWTSMAHLELVLALEKRFDLIFEAEEIAELASVKAIVGALEKVRTN